MWIVHQELLHNKESRHQTGHQTFFNMLIVIYLNCASGSPPQQGQSRSARQLTKLLILNLFQFIWIAHQVPLHNKESQCQKGDQTFCFQINLFWYIWIAHQVPLHISGVKALDGALDWLILVFIFKFIWIVRQVLLHNKKSQQQTECPLFIYLFILFIFDKSFELCMRYRSTTGSRGTKRAPDLFSIYVLYFIENCASGSTP